VDAGEAIEPGPVLSGGFDRSATERRDRMAAKTATAAVVLAAAASTLVFAGGAVAAPGGNSANAKLCQHGSWATLMDSTAAPFASQDECVSYGAHGGVIYPLATITLEPCVSQPFDGICVNATGSGLAPGSAMVTTLNKNDAFLQFSSINVPQSGEVTDSAQFFEVPCVEGNVYTAASTGTSADSVTTPVQPGIPITSDTVQRTSSCP
jgi:hypothetical protein